MLSTRNILLDTTYLLPVFGIDVEVDSALAIRDALERLLKRGVRLHVSDLTPFEAFVKSFRVAEKLRDEEGKQAAKSGFTILARADWLDKVDHKDDTVVEEAYRIRLDHNDPFDCFIFATAKALSIPLVTEDQDASKFLGKESTLTWKELKRSFRL